MPLSAEERLIPIRVKIKRAKKHLTELEEAAEIWRDTYHHIVVADENPEFFQGLTKTRRLPVIHFDMLAIAGDVLQNLRSSLDHVIYNLALVADPNVSDTILRKTNFPIGESLESYESLRSRKIEGIIEPRAVKFIDSLKPYQGGNEPLWRLHEMNNIDKHRKLISVGAEILCAGEGFEGYYWLKDDKPSFATVVMPDREEYTQTLSVQSLLQLHRDQREALIPTLHHIIEFVEKLIELFAGYLVKI
jgi:hypothetical protein